jgi:hypothetical protein
MSGPAVTLQVWQVPARDVAAAVVAGRVAARRLRRSRAVRFVKLLGTASTRFVPTAATPRRWAVLTCWAGAAEPATFGWWDEHADDSVLLSLRTLTARGTWDGRAPFVPEPEPRWSGRVVALTRATLRPSRAARFYRAVSPVAAELRAAAGCRAAFGVGEAPVLRQGTVSVWETADHMRAFAYGSPRHSEAVRATAHVRWYAEEMFATFALLDVEGSLDAQVLR